jgi:hypothetical protein
MLDDLSKSTMYVGSMKPVKLPRAALPIITVSPDDPADPANQRLDPAQLDVLIRV